MREYRFEHVGLVTAGRLVIRASNAGTLPHSLVLVALPEDVPPIDEQLHSTNRRGVSTFAQIPPREPGSRDAFAVDLIPGRYAFVCFVTDPDGVTHALKGMSSEFRVG